MALKRAVCEKIKYRNRLGLSFLGLLGQQYSLNVRQGTTLGDSDSGQQLIQFFVITDGQLQVTT